jgi:hypothetical protein
VGLLQRLLRPRRAQPLHPGRAPDGAPPEADGNQVDGAAGYAIRVAVHVPDTDTDHGRTETGDDHGGTTHGGTADDEHRPGEGLPAGPSRTLLRLGDAQDEVSGEWLIDAVREGEAIEVGEKGFLAEAEQRLPDFVQRLLEPG